MRYEPSFNESHIEDNNVTVDYSIHKGRGRESNVLALLQSFEFSDEIEQQIVFRLLRRLSSLQALNGSLSPV